MSQAEKGEAAGGSVKVAQSSDRPFTVYTSFECSLIAYAASFSAMFSGLSSFIYYPAITNIARSLNTSVANINLTVTSYLVVAGLAPSILGDLADRMGRRPISLLAMLLFFGANVGLARQNRFVALLVLRCLQSAGASSTISLAYGIISDISTPAERGAYMGILMGFTNVAPALGPVLGGVLAEKLSWHWIFWLLCILSGSHLLVLFLFLPETSRRLVGNGDLMPPHWMSKSIWSLNNDKSTMSGEAAKFVIPNPISCLLALKDRANILVILVGGMQYANFGCLAASSSTQMIEIYSLGYLEAGLVYLPSGVGGIIAAYFTGRLMDREYASTARQYGLPISKSDNDVSHFPIESARLRSIFVFILLNAIATVGYGWTLQTKTHLSAPIVMQFVTGGISVAIFVICGGLLTDLNAKRSATVQASYNIVRCGLGAGAIAALEPLIDSVGIGLCFTIYGIIGLFCILPLYILRQKGPSWRDMQLEAASR